MTLQWRRAGLCIAAAIVGGWALGQCGPDDPVGLPPKVAEAVIEHQVLTPIDLAEVARLRAVADSAQAVSTTARQKARESELRAKAAERTALGLHRLADSLALVASAATATIDTGRVVGAEDPGSSWRAAYTARTAEAESLSVANRAKDSALTAKDTALAAADRKQVATDSALSRTVRRADRADSVLAKVLPIAEKASAPCRVLFGLVQCPSRKQTFVAGTVVGGVVLFVLKNGITLRLP